MFGKSNKEIEKECHNYYCSSQEWKLNHSAAEGSRPRLGTGAASTSSAVRDGWSGVGVTTARTEHFGRGIVSPVALPTSPPPQLGAIIL